jgi:hypothetical protein
MCIQTHNPSKSITSSRSGDIIHELELKQIHLQNKSTNLGNIYKFDST